LKKINIVKTFIAIFLFLFSAFLFIKYFCVVNNLKIVGLELIDKSYFNKIPIKYGDNIFSIDREKISKYILNLPLIESVNIKTILFNTLVIEVKEKDVIGIVKTNENFLYITSKSELIPKENGFNDDFLPLIEIEKKVSYERLLGVLKGLSLLKHYDKNFFKKIEKISLKEIQITDIFIRNKMHFLLGSIPNEVDFFRLLIITKIFNSGKFDLRSDYIIKMKT